MQAWPAFHSQFTIHYPPKRSPRSGDRTMFEGFESGAVELGDTTIFIRQKGSGQPVLLLHGFPETHAMWHRIAPVLADAFTVVCADLTGYGASGKPVSDLLHARYAKSAMARDMVQLM